MKKKLLFSIIIVALLFPNINFSQTLNLGTLDNFAAYTGTGAVSNTGTSSFTGDVGTNLGIISGFGLPTTVGTIHNGNATTIQAKIDLLRVYIHLSDLPLTNTTHAAAFGSGETITAGVYSIAGAGSLAGTVRLDAQGNPDAAFVIKFEGAFTAATGSKIILANGARACNVFWIAEGAISIGASSIIKGTLIAHPGAITIGSLADIEGRMLSTEGAITFGPGVATLPAGPITIPITCVNTCNNTILGTAANFALFTSIGAVANAATSGIIGDIGTNAGAISGFVSSTVAGSFHNADAITAQAKIDVQAAYDYLFNTTVTNASHTPAFGSGEILTAGVYSISAAGSLAGTITLNGEGNPDALFIFKFAGAFTTAAQSKVVLTNGVRRCNVFWIAEGAISMGTFTFMKGTLIANNGANTMGANGNLEGRMLSTGGAIGFSTGVIYNNTLCFEPSPTPSIALTKEGTYTDSTAPFGTTNVGDTISYAFVVTNTGNTTLTNITVTDNNATVIGGPLASLAAGASNSTTFTAVHTITQTDINAGMVSNLATVSANPPTGPAVTGNSTDPTPCTTCTVDPTCPTCTITPLINAINDIYINIACDVSGLAGNILGNDTIGTTSVNSNIESQVSLTILTGNNPNILINSTNGNVNIQSGIRIGTYIYTYQICTTLNPGACDQANVIINIVDTVAPVIAPLPAGTTIYCPAKPTFTLASATDACGVTNLTFDDVINPGLCTASYSVIRTWTATDAAGNQSFSSQTINVLDKTAPVIAALPAASSISCGTNPVFATATATDACGSAFSLTFADVITNGSCAGSYSVTRSWTAIDACGNNSSASQTINVLDTNGPTTTTPFASNINVNCDAIPLKPELVFVDNCSKVSPVVFTEKIINSTQSSYSIVREWSVSDSCGNISKFTQTLLVAVANSTIKIASSACNNESSTINLLNLLPQGTPTNGTWIDINNTGALQGNILSTFGLTLGDKNFEYKINNEMCPRYILLTININDDCIVLGCGDIKVHNAFSPNGDGINEVFVVDNIEATCYPDNTVEIYNRWGVLVFETKNYNNQTNNFEGISRGRTTINYSSDLPAGTYFYILNYSFIDGNGKVEIKKLDGYLYLSK